MTTAFIEKLNAPEWQMDDAYGDIGSERYEESFRKAESLISELEAAPRGRDAILSNLGRYDEATTILSSLSSFVKCLGAKNSDDERVAPENTRISGLSMRLSLAGDPLFAEIDALDEKDPLWEEKPLSDWRFVVRERAACWKRKLSVSDREWLGDLEGLQDAPERGRL